MAYFHATPRQQSQDPMALSRLYRRRAKKIKLWMVTVSALLMAVLIIWPSLFYAKKQSAASRSGKPIERNVFLKPKLISVNENGHPFVMTADTAEQTSDGKILLINPKINTLVKDNERVILMAKEGVLRDDNSFLDLFDDVILNHQSGHVFKTSKAVVHLKENTAEGTSGLEGDGPMGKIFSKGFKLTNRGELLFLSGKARLVLNQDAQKNKGGKVS